MSVQKPHRREIALDVWAWSPAEPTRLLTGTTVELGTDGAVLKLPRLHEAAVRLTLRIALPDHAMLAPALVVGRYEDIVTVAFDSLEPYERGRLRALVDSA